MTPGNILAVLLATIAQFIVGAIWYTPLFGNLWGKIHGFDKLDKKTQEKMMSEMKPIFAGQIAVTTITSIILLMFHNAFPTNSLTLLTFWIWIGFVVPAQVSGILFSGIDKKWIVTKSAVMAGGSLTALLVGAVVVAYLA